MNKDVIIFSVFSSGKKRISSEFSPFERSLSFEGLLSPLERFLSFARLLLLRLLSFWRIASSEYLLRYFCF